MVYEVARIRGQYGSLGDGWTYLNAHECPQIPEQVSTAVARSFRLSPSVAEVETSSGTHSRPHAAGRLEGSAFLDSARIAIADLCGATADRVVLGPSLPALYLNLAQAMRPLLRPNSSVVLSHLDSVQLNRPFQYMGSAVRWAQPDLGTGSLPHSQYADLVNGSTRLVTLSAAQKHIGTLAPVPEIIEATRDRSRAWVLVDASTYAAVRPLDVDTWDADIVGIDVGALGGPQVSALVFRDMAMFRRIDPVLESPVAPALAGGVPAVIDHLAGLVETKGTRRNRLEKSMGHLDTYLRGLNDDLHLALGGLTAVHILGVSGEAGDAGNSDRVPHLSFAIPGVPAKTVHQRLLDNGILTSVLPTSRLYTDMGVDEVGGAVTISLTAFNTRHDIEHLTRVVASLA